MKSCRRISFSLFPLIIFPLGSVEAFRHPSFLLSCEMITASNNSWSVGLPVFLLFLSLFYSEFGFFHSKTFSIRYSSISCLHSFSSLFFSPRVFFLLRLLLLSFFSQSFPHFLSFSSFSWLFPLYLSTVVCQRWKTPPPGSAFASTSVFPFVNLTFFRLFSHHPIIMFRPFHSHLLPPG